MRIEPATSAQEAPRERATDYDHEARIWLAEVYQGDAVRQLSVRSITTGMLLGALMSISNLYVGLKTGWGLGVTITSCIIAFSVFRVLESAFAHFRDDPFTILENYTSSSAASAAGYMSTSGLVSSIPALYMMTGRQLNAWEMISWLAALSCLGVFMAIPLKRQLIDVDKLPFPTGLATAETLKAMYTSGSEALAKARALGYAAVLGAAVIFWRDGFLLAAGWLRERWSRLAQALENVALPEIFPLVPGEWGRDFLARTSLGFEGSLLMVGAGAIMGIRVGVSLLVGSVIYYGWIGPILIERHIVAEAGYGRHGINAWTLWPATAMMVASGLLSFALRWRTVARALAGMLSMFRPSKTGDDPLAAVDVPGSWFVIGTALSGAACVILGERFFNISYPMGILAVLLTFVLSIVAARATGETDVTPIGAMGQITQFVYGAIARSNITTNLMTASITAGASAHSADLLTDLKSGYLLGGNPRKQTISQLFGVLAGTLVCVPVYTLVAKPEQIGSQELPAPSAKVWAGVAEMMANGIAALPEGALGAAAIAAVVGIMLTIGEEFAPERYRRWIPSPIGLGIAGVIPAFNSISMFLGALVAWLVARRWPRVDEVYTIPVSSGLIAGESLMGVAIILLREGPGMLESFWK
ncbi:MAG TPA: OPT family oligopeptide transporter [Pirellulales bacterium]|jgi:uncharacterized oligopeptide transporter (OPT) family protein|nr:OPT family oligopeptide transporter [Pirellulales bacterium]